MSIWGSVRGSGPNILGEIPCRDEYTGEDCPGPSTLVDVATTLHDYVRLSLSAGRSVEVILKVDEVTELIDRLTKSISVRITLTGIRPGLG